MDKKSQLNALIKALCNGNASEFARRMNVTQGCVSGWLSRGKMDIELIAETFPELSAEWLLRGEGEMFKSSHGNYVSANNSIIANNVSGSTINNGATSHKDILPNTQVTSDLPIIPYNIVNDNSVDILDYVSNNLCQMSPIVKQFPSYDVWYIVQGNAMNPDLRSGDMLALKHIPSRQIINGEIYAISTRSRGLIVRIVNKNGDNYNCRAKMTERYEDMTLTEGDVSSIFKVVGVLKISL